MRKVLAKFFLQTLWGWEFETVYPVEVKKSVIIVIPHTSNWDFPIGILLRPILHLDTRFVAKSSLFWFPLGILMRSLGGVSVDRSKNNNFVDAVSSIFNTNDSFKLTIAPEGTRGKVNRLKTGFYHLAIKADVPIVRCKFDWATKKIGFSEPFYPTSDYNKDLPEILSYFKGVKGKNPNDGYEIP